ncbi:hypothetical protein B296_00025411 [Ensete ventricosum]|uniref:Uncharacterized protein n=1 Tax=Ensete ventricosum TaxID=4639 RepID=A0A426ZG34_ENSVE|nr:hypothetical protein B296_00025411 [Ensete ventricosum]
MPDILWHLRCHTESSAYRMHPHAPLDRSYHRTPPASGDGSVMEYVHLEFPGRRENHRGDPRHTHLSSLGSFGHHRSSDSPGVVTPLGSLWSQRRACRGLEVAGRRARRGLWLINVGDNCLKHSRDGLDLVGKPLKCLRSYHRGPWVRRGWSQPKFIKYTPISPLDVGSCNSDTGLSTLARLFLQDKTSQVVGSRGGPSDDQVRVDRRVKSDVLLEHQSFFSFWMEVKRESERTSWEILRCHFLYRYVVDQSSISFIIPLAFSASPFNVTDSAGDYTCCWLCVVFALLSCGSLKFLWDLIVTARYLMLPDNRFVCLFVTRHLCASKGGIQKIGHSTLSFHISWLWATSSGLGEGPPLSLSRIKR